MMSYWKYFFIVVCLAKIHFKCSFALDVFQRHGRGSGDDSIAQQSIPWTNCSTWTDQLAIANVDANMWPPQRNQLLQVNVSGEAKESFLYGRYNRTIVYRGYSLPSVIGSLNDLGVVLPIRPGPVTFIIANNMIPDVAPAGQYDMIISATEQDYAEIFCIKITWQFDNQ